jgi:hypothetical protein
VRDDVRTRSAWAAVLALVALAGCTRAAPDATPDGAVRLWLERMEAAPEDPHAMREAFDLLGPAARANLEERAARASLAQGRRVEPFEMLADGRFGLRFRPKSMNTRVDGESATVEVIGDEPLREHALVHCTHVDGAFAAGEKSASGKGGWRVEPDLPAVMALPKRAPDAPDSPR